MHDTADTPAHAGNGRKAAARRSGDPAIREAAGRLRVLGPDGIGDDELLAIVLSAGRAVGDPWTMARDVLPAVGGLRGLRGLSAVTLEERLTASDHVRRGRRAALAASGLVALAELLRRQAPPPLPGLRLRSSREVFEHVRHAMEGRQVESFRGLFLDVRQRLIRDSEISRGTLTSSLVHPREVFATAIAERAFALILVHNHPSGDPLPSREDRLVTDRMRAVGEIVGIPLLDHVISGAGSYYSFRDCAWSASTGDSEP